MDAANSFDLYLFGNLDNDGRSSLETRIMSDMNLKIEFGRYLDKVGERFLRTHNDATDAFKLFFSDKLSSGDCSILVALLRFKTKWACGIGNYISDAMKGTSRSSLISLFDAYLADRLSNSSLRLFDMCLTYNEDFASDFNVYLLTVDGICREVEQDNLDFGVAMKSLSKEHLKDILGMRRVGNRTSGRRIENKEDDRIKVMQCCTSLSSASEDSMSDSDDFDSWFDGDLSEKDTLLSEPDTLSSEQDTPSSEPDTASSEPKKKSLMAWIWVAASIAILAVVISVVLYIGRNARYSVDNAIYACAEINPSPVMADGKPFDIGSMSDDELKARLPELVTLYETASDTDKVADCGYTLAIAYLRLHDRDKAKDVLEQLVSRFDGNAVYAESVDRWKSILELLK